MIAARLALSKHKSFAALIIRLAWVGVGLSVTVMIIAIAIVVGYKKQITEKVTGFNGEIEVHSTGTSGNFDYVPFDDKDSVQKALKQFAFVKQVGAVMSRPAILKTENELEGIVFKGSMTPIIYQLIWWKVAFLKYMTAYTSAISLYQN